MSMSPQIASKTCEPTDAVIEGSRSTHRANSEGNTGLERMGNGQSRPPGSAILIDTRQDSPLKPKTLPISDLGLAQAAKPLPSPLHTPPSSPNGISPVTESKRHRTIPDMSEQAAIAGNAPKTPGHTLTSLPALPDSHITIQASEPPTLAHHSSDVRPPRTVPNPPPSPASTYITQTRHAGKGMQLHAHHVAVRQSPAAALAPPPSPSLAGRLKKARESQERQRLSRMQHAVSEGGLAFDEIGDIPAEASLSSQSLWDILETQYFRPLNQEDGLLLAEIDPHVATWLALPELGPHYSAQWLIDETFTEFAAERVTTPSHTPKNGPASSDLVSIERPMSDAAPSERDHSVNSDRVPSVTSGNVESTLRVPPPLSLDPMRSHTPPLTETPSDALRVESTGSRPYSSPHVPSLGQPFTPLRRDSETPSVEASGGTPRMRRSDSLASSICASPMLTPILSASPRLPATRDLRHLPWVWDYGPVPLHFVEPYDRETVERLFSRYLNSLCATRFWLSDSLATVATAAAGTRDHIVVDPESDEARLWAQSLAQVKETRSKGPEWVIERVLDTRGEGSVREFLIQWKDRGTEDQTWLRRSELIYPTCIPKRKRRSKKKRQPGESDEEVQSKAPPMVDANQAVLDFLADRGMSDDEPSLLDPDEYHTSASEGGHQMESDHQMSDVSNFSDEDKQSQRQREREERRKKRKERLEQKEKERNARTQKKMEKRKQEHKKTRVTQPKSPKLKQRKQSVVVPGTPHCMCHSCHKRTPVHAVVRCTNNQPDHRPLDGEPCHKNYCESCLEEYSQSMSTIKSRATWQCPACAGECKCAACKAARSSKRSKLPLCDACYIEDSGTGMIQCHGGCGVRIHRLCYGVPADADGATWLCDVCRQGEEERNATPVVCIVCLRKGGAFKLTAEGRWCHIFCCMLVPELHITNTQTMSPIHGVNTLRRTQRDQECTLCCRRGGICIECCEFNCHLKFHPTCALYGGQLLLFQKREGSQVMEKLQYCRRHTLSQMEMPLRDLQVGRVNVEMYSVYVNSKRRVTEAKRSRESSEESPILKRRKVSDCPHCGNAFDRRGLRQHVSLCPKRPDANGAERSKGTGKGAERSKGADKSDKSDQRADKRGGKGVDRVKGTGKGTDRAKGAGKGCGTGNGKDVDTDKGVRKANAVKIGSRERRVPAKYSKDETDSVLSKETQETVDELLAMQVLRASMERVRDMLELMKKRERLKQQRLVLYGECIDSLLPSQESFTDANTSGSAIAERPRRSATLPVGKDQALSALKSMSLLNPLYPAPSTTTPSSTPTPNAPSRSPVSSPNTLCVVKEAEPKIGRRSKKRKSHEQLLDEVQPTSHKRGGAVRTTQVKPSMPPPPRLSRSDAESDAVTEDMCWSDTPTEVMGQDAVVRPTRRTSRGQES